jgi:hypothetical protein
MTTYVVSMTHVVRGLKAFLDSQAASTRREILNAITHLGKPQPHEIKRYLDNQVEEEIEDECKKGKINYSDKNRRVKERYVTLRTIHRWLRTLSKESLLDHTDSRYSLSKKFVSDIRYSGNFFMYSPTGLLAQYNRNSSVRELIAKLGFILYYLFIEAARPIQDKALNEKQKVELIHSWLENAFSVSAIYAMFRDQYGDGDQVSEKALNKLTKTLQRLYPSWYKIMEKERKQYSEGLVEWDRMRGYDQ